MIATAEEFVALRESSIQEEYLRAARDNAPIAVWRDVIARFPNMRTWVALNKTVPPEILEVLATDVDPDVRRAVAMKNSLPLHLMVLLSRDPVECVRLRIACNKKAPADVLRYLGADPSVDVSSAALERLHGKAGDSE
ncbi:MAG: hypothetical protein JNM66_21245 [Bryobacterales bacterium]|nr:hypothetical protein [Bryobacterales bacterium]